VEALGQGTGQTNQAHPHPSANITGGEGGPKINGSTPIPAHMLELFQKFIESMGNKDKAMESMALEKGKEVGK
jgi:hypothetical protein